MPYVRRLPSGRWQATVRNPRLPPGRNRLTKSHPLRKVVTEWAREQEAAFARGETRDPRAGRVTVGDWYARWSAAHVVAAGTRRKLETYWRTHCEPKWAAWRLADVTRMEAQGWVRQLEQTRVTGRWGRPLDRLLAPATIEQIVTVMSSLYAAALAERPPLVLDSPFAGLALPTVPPGRIVWYTREEHAAIVAALRAVAGGQPWAVMADLAGHVGLRYGELAGLPGNHVNWLRREINVWQVRTRAGIVPVPKSARSHRTVPVPDRIMLDLAALVRGRPVDALVFESRAWHSDWRRRWYAAVAAAGVPRHPPHVLRHTAASWLVMAGVDLYRVQALLGHESYATTQRYAHLAPGAHEAIREVWAADAPATNLAQVVNLDRARKGA
jgi:integrase